MPAVKEIKHWLYLSSIIWSQEHAGGADTENNQHRNTDGVNVD